MCGGVEKKHTVQMPTPVEEDGAKKLCFLLSPGIDNSAFKHFFKCLVSKDHTSIFDKN